MQCTALNALNVGNFMVLVLAVFGFWNALFRGFVEGVHLSSIERSYGLGTTGIYCGLVYLIVRSI